MNNFDVIIIGGGIIGASCAYELSKTGKNVAIIEKKTIGSGASGTSAAMLEFQIDSYRGEPFRSFAQYAISLFPELYQEIKTKTGIDFQFEQSGIYQLALNDEEAILLQNEVTRQTYHGLKARWIEKDEFLKQEPNVSENILGAALFEEDGQVNGEKFLAGQIIAAQMNGVQIYENTQIESFEIQNQKISMLHTSQGKFSADYVVCSVGAWSDQILSKLDVQLGVEPVRGQLLVLDTPQRVFNRPIYTKSNGYMTPKQDGYTFVGSTIENVGYDPNPTETGEQELRQKAHALSPYMATRPVRGMTAGLRPGSPDKLPFIGPLESLSNFIMATGHFRNGILLSLGTAKIVSAIIDNKPLPHPIANFSPHRFSSVHA